MENQQEVSKKEIAEAFKKCTLESKGDKEDEK